MASFFGGVSYVTENEVNVDPNVTLQLLNTMGVWGKVVDTGIGDNDETGWWWFAATSALLECFFPLRISLRCK